MLSFIANKKELTCHEEVFSNQIYVSKGLRVSYIYLSSTETGFPIYTTYTIMHAFLDKIDQLLRVNCKLRFSQFIFYRILFLTHNVL